MDYSFDSCYYEFSVGQTARMQDQWSYFRLTAGSRGTVEHRRMPIRDFGVPTYEQMRRILDAIDAALAEGRTVFVHCRGGIGRTGTLVGCWKRRHGAPAEDTFAALGGRPETDEQRAMIRGWR